MGEVVDIIHNEQESLPNVNINFDNIGEHIIWPITVEGRRMLPLELCFAVTIHKMQGSELDRAVINLGIDIFEKGQAYVALSRVRTLDGIRLEDLHVGTLKNNYNPAALNEMERLRNAQ